MAKRRDNTLPGAFEGLKGDYAAAKTSRFRRRRNVPSMGSGADFHYRNESDFLRIMEYARDMDRNDAIVGQIIDKAATNIIQGGFTLNPQTGDDKLNKDLKARWDEWATNPDECDLAGERCFSDIEFDMLRQQHVDGDMIALGIKDEDTDLGGPLELVEAHRCRSPRKSKERIVHGVELDANRRRLAYWITRDELSPTSAAPHKKDLVAKVVRDDLGDRQVFHVYKPNRVSQTRGVSAFTPIFDMLGMVEDINFAKLVQQQIVSCFAVFRQRDKEFRGGSTTPQLGAQEAETLGDGTTRTIEGIAPGMEITGLPGEELKGFSPHVPNAEFFQHMKLLLTLIGNNWGLPLVMVLMDASETNFSGWRGAIDQARMGFRMNQSRTKKRLHAPVYRWKLNQWIADDAALRRVSNRRKVQIFAHRWNTPTWPYIQPLQDAQADALRVQKNQISPRRVAAERGYDYEEIMEETIADNGRDLRRAISEAKAIETETGVAVDYHELLYLAKPDKLSLMAVNAGGDGSTEKDKADAE